MVMRHAPFLVLLIMVAGFVLWSAAFVALYAGHALGCLALWTAGTRQGVLIVTAAIFIIAHGALLAWTWRRFRGEAAAQPEPRRFLRLTCIALAASSLVATVWTALPVALLRGCV